MRFFKGGKKLTGGLGATFFFGAGRFFRQGRAAETAKEKAIGQEQLPARHVNKQFGRFVGGMVMFH